jgi:hypothetical protein
MARFVFGVFGAFAALSAVAAREARADLTSWLSVGGGYALQRDDVGGGTSRAAALSALVGVGTTPRASIVIGGVARSVTYFSLGTDVGLAARVATGGYARGGWGFAVDAGAAYRYWGSGDFGRIPLQAVLTVGAPWGLELAVGGDFLSVTGPPFARGGFATLGIDLLRLTVMRQGSTEAYWRNPAPAGGHLTDPAATGRRIDTTPTPPNPEE